VETSLNRNEFSCVKAGLQYFAIVFGAGFALGSIRIFWLAPQIGTRAAELLEMPVMIVVTMAAARFVVGRFNGVRTTRARLCTGMFALGLLLAAELGAGAWLRGTTLSDYFFNRDPVSGTAYFIALGLLAVMPLLVLRRRTETSLIDPFMPRADIRESHEIIVLAPAETVFQVAEDFDLLSVPIVRSIFRLRERVFRVQAKPRMHTGIVAETLSLGWGVLDYWPGRAIVMGAATQPWIGDVKFHAIPAEEFAAFAEPGYVKIVWTLEAQPLATSATRFRTQTRVVATDGISKARFLVYWVFAGPFIVLIRRIINRALRQEAERRVLHPANTAA
jgi:hypothetical protein